MSSRTLTRAAQGWMLVGLFACVGCVPQEQNAWIFVDNTTGSEMTVLVDSEEVAKVPAGSVEKIKVMTGDHSFLVQSGGTIVYNGQHTIEPSKTFLAMQRYILNPDRKGRYATLDIHYGRTFSDRLREVSLSREGNEEAYIRSEYSSLVKDLKTMPANPWFEIPPGVLVFEPAPEKVVARRTATRTVFSRLTEAEYRHVRSASANTNPTEQDLAELWILAEQRFF